MANNNFNLKSGIVAILVLVQSFVFAQMNMDGAGYPQSSPIPCQTFSDGSTPNFFDNGGAAGDYTANFNDEITFCPDLTQGSKVTLVFAINAGFSFDVDASDSIYVYDGPNSSSPLLGVHNSSTDPNGFTYVASWSNPTGCLTVVFVSNGAVQGTGWQANVSCGNVYQPFTNQIEAFVNGQGSNAIDANGNVDICFGDSVLLVSIPTFPNSFEVNGYGYSQNANTNIDFEWSVGGVATFPNNDSIWYTPPSRNGFFIELVTSDDFPFAINTTAKIRVSQLPNFNTGGPVTDPICEGESVVLLGGANITDTLGIVIPPGTFQPGGSFAGLTALADGSGIQYFSTIPISGFPAGSTINTLQDLNQVCITMEHSFLGDLEIALTCPNGTQVSLVNSFNGGFIPGGFGGGGTYLGDANDAAANGVPGEGWTYCFSAVYNDWGTMGTELGAGNTVPAVNYGNGNPSMNPDGIYLPDGNFASLAGCPVNGDWTITVQDNLGIDDGFIFGWGLYFDPSYFVGLSPYQNEVVESYWGNDPTIVQNLSDTGILVLPPSAGVYSYDFFITDDFGCEYDTTFTLTVLPLPSIFNDTIACDLTYQVGGTVSNGAGTWSATSPNVIISNPNILNPVISVTQPGTYTVNFQNAACPTVVSAELTYPQYPTIFPDTEMCGLVFEVPAGSVNSFGGGSWSTLDPNNISFSPNTGVLYPTITAQVSSVNIITFTDSVCNNSVSATLTTIEAPTISAPDLSCNLSEFNITSTSYQGGVWTILDNPVTPFLEDTAVDFFGTQNSANPDVQVSQAGQYTIQFTDNYCNESITEVLNFPPYIWTEIKDTNLCFGIEYPLDAWQGPSPVSYTWNTGVTNWPSILVTEPGVYTVTITNECYTYSDNATITYYLCDIIAPNVISLNSTTGNNIWFVEADGIAEFNCTIVNRWGNLIYEYSDVNGFWDGKDKSGNQVEDGVYFYKIDAKIFGGDELVKHGNITVVR